jgi:glutamine synthetase adenylyltransferase
MQACLAQLRERGLPLPAALRVLRQLVLERLVVLDCEQGASLTTVTRAVTELAELALDAACTLAFAELDEVYGAPWPTRRNPCRYGSGPPANRAKPRRWRPQPRRWHRCGPRCG